VFSRTVARDQAVFDAGGIGDGLSARSGRPG
jgi:hypothetical protein